MHFRTFENGPLNFFKKTFFCNVLLKNVKDKVLSFVLVKIWIKIFHVLKFEVTRTTLLKITGHWTFYFVLLSHTYISHLNYKFFYKQRFVSTQPQCCLTFSLIEHQMLLRCCLIHITTITLRLILYLVYLCPCPGVGLFMSYLYDLFFIFSLIFIVIYYIISFKQTYLFFVHFSKYVLLFLDDNVDEESRKFSNSKSSASRCCLAFASFFVNFSLALLIKLLLKKNV